jgi:hypothetical protein
MLNETAAARTVVMTDANLQQPTGTPSADRAPAGGERRYDAFISYSHRGERALARSVERTLWTFGRSWYQLRRIRTFRDESNLAAEPDLWPKIERAVQGSAHLVLLASPDAARSTWIPREVAAAVGAHGLGALCVVQTAGVLPWTDSVTGPEMLARPDGALPPSVWELFDKAKVEPLVVDLRPFRDLSESQRRNDPEYLSSVAAVAAKVLDTEKETLWGEYHRAQRLRTMFVGIVGAVLLALIFALGVVLRDEVAARRATEIALAGSYFREAVSRLEAERPFEALGYAARAVAIDSGNDAARTLTLDLLLWRAWPRLSVMSASEAPPLALSDDGRVLTGLARPQRSTTLLRCCERPRARACITGKARSRRMAASPPATPGRARVVDRIAAAETQLIGQGKHRQPR